ncbi:hypothetical protein K402DRAFT_343484 [Aulographum hederae CBS 113979]|uniref:3'-5' exonuclease domain-containing protein n=1 Tax=Aulographum hederae CBS 113979 TaxID=1176131 RepID=A0A6G1GJL7_9PEZI|nr:hypothetical protein K402DRAFT_343484 [Aulographum hederae CBS 113979]
MIFLDLPFAFWKYALAHVRIRLRGPKVETYKPQNKRHTFIDTTTDVTCFLDDLQSQSIPADKPVLYFDCEGTNLGRDGTVSLVQIYLPAREQSYVLDILTLQSFAFMTPSTDRKVTLKSVFESDTLIKAIWAIRSDSAALYAHYGIELRNCHDLQLLEFSRQSSSSKKSGVISLGRAIDNHGKRLGMTEEALGMWKLAKNEGKESCKDGKQYDQRPLPSVLVDYAVGDVEILPKLYDYCRSSASDLWFDMVRDQEGRYVLEEQRCDGEGG